MRSTDPTTATNWHKSSYSNPDGGACVEVCDDFRAMAMVPVRDSKEPHGPALVFAACGWSSFVRAVKSGVL
ncbi:DUF397 domain-containing protein [Streptomyces halstedii]|uniref:DUF397 domain-containing protein n=1 Tax=Streptomyces halstedii TaxID=1944 RepID=A0A6N9TZE9_STRHA|nr:DUF397 domain-containing protein [Streptomyces halstedii]